jgi:beta-glucosidase
MVVLSGRPYELGWAVGGPTAPDALLQAFFPGEEGGRAIAQVLSGRVAPSGHLPVSLPRSAGAQPFSYLHPKLGGSSEITSADSTPVLPFGHGLTYTTFERFDLSAAAEAPTSGTFRASVRVRNTGERAGTDLVQLYAHDVFASVTRPVAQLVGYARVDLAPGDEAIVEFDVPTARLAFTDRQFERIVEPGQIDLWVGQSCDERETTAAIVLTGGNHRVTAADGRLVAVRVEILEADAVGAGITVD